ncbi:hypothetical protein V8G54_021086 [Vigna mungo]|uniref:Uncharacterized protein n=1 Tax=Vigna mungo TaxID=3915 RepID=A0AAQ3NCS3_VIGMU
MPQAILISRSIITCQHQQTSRPFHSFTYTTGQETVGDSTELGMEDDGSSSIRRMSSRTRKVASKMAAALASADNRTQAAISSQFFFSLARLDALENDNAGFEIADAHNDDDEASLDEEDQYYIQKKQSKGTKRKTRQAKALEARRAPRTFLELLHEANLESLPPHVPSYWKAAVGPPSTTSRRHFCTVCGFSANYTCVRCVFTSSICKQALCSIFLFCYLLRLVVQLLSHKTVSKEAYLLQFAVMFFSFLILCMNLITWQLMHAVDLGHPRGPMMYPGTDIFTLQQVHNSSTVGYEIGFCSIKLNLILVLELQKAILSGGGGINDWEGPTPFSTRSAMPKPEFRRESMWQWMNQIPDLQW